MKIFRRLCAVLSVTFLFSIGYGQIFVSNFSNGTIGEYNLDGTLENATFISGLEGPWSLAASSSNLFVALPSSGSISKYNLDGSVANPALITGLSNPTGLTVFGSDLFVSFADTGLISLYNLDGTPLNPSLIAGIGQLGGIAVVTAIPEPSTYSALLGAATLGVVILRRRRPAVGQLTSHPAR
jgi:hypothetical protein